MQQSRSLSSRVSRLFASVAAALLSLLLVPAAAFASTTINVEGTDYTEAASGHGSGGGTWKWDGADAMGLNDYVGGRITADGALDITLTGENVINYDASTDGGNTALVTGYQDGGDLTIEGDGNLTVNATADGGDVVYGIYSYGDLNVEDTSVSVNVESEGDGTSAVGTVSSGTTHIDDSSLDVAVQGPGGSIGMSANKGVEIAGSDVDVRVDATTGSPGPATGINAIGLGITKGSRVHVNAAAIDEANGIYSFSSDHFLIADSSVNVSARSSEGQGFGMRAENMEEGGTVDMVIRHARVTADGSTAALWSYGQVPGSHIVLDKSKVTVPAGGAPQTIQTGTDRYVMTYGQVIGTGDGIITSLDDPCIAASVVIEAIDPVPGPTPTPTPTPQPAAHETPFQGSADLPTTGDTLSLLGASLFAVASLLVFALVARRRRDARL